MTCFVSQALYCWGLTIHSSATKLHWHFSTSLHYIKHFYFYRQCNALCESSRSNKCVELCKYTFWMSRFVCWLHLCFHAGSLRLACFFFAGAFLHFLLPYHHRVLNSVKSLAGIYIYWAFILKPHDANSRGKCSSKWTPYHQVVVTTPECH